MAYYLPDDQNFQDSDSSLNSSTNFDNAIGLKGQGTLSALNKNLNNSKPNNNMQTPSSDVKSMSAMAKYTLNWINRRENDKLIQFNVELPYLVTVIEAIKDVLPLVNKKLAEENSNWRLSDDARHFELYKSKKTGHPKTDYPAIALDSLQILHQTGINQISLVETDSKAVYPLSPLKRGGSVLNPSMLEPSLPNNGPSTGPSNSLGNDYKEETICFCIPVKKRVSESNNNSLNEKLIK